MEVYCDEDPLLFLYIAGVHMEHTADLPGLCHQIVHHHFAIIDKGPVRPWQTVISRVAIKEEKVSCGSSFMEIIELKYTVLVYS